MNVVLDASAAAGLVLPDESSEKIQKLIASLDEKSEIHVPLLWWYEVSNIFLMAGKRGRISAKEIEKGTGLLLRLPIVTDETYGKNFHVLLLKTGKKHGLTSYDSTYLELAKRKKAILVTSDKALGRAAKKEKIGLFAC